MHRFTLLISALFVFIVLSGCSTTANQKADYQKTEAQDETSQLSKIKNKNELVSLLLKLTLSNYLQRHGFGDMRDFSIDTNNKSFNFKVDLKGESKPLFVEVAKYEVLIEGDKLYFVAKNISTDREWVNLVAKKYLQENKVEIPSKYSLFAMLVA